MRILIVEDEAVAARRLERMVREILGTAVTSIDLRESLNESQQFLRSHPIDILLLDLNLYGRNGFELLKEAAAESFQTIVVSANTDQALQAFEYGVLDFVPKPLEHDRLAFALGRLSQKEVSPQQAARYLSVRSHGTVDLVEVSQIVYLKGAGDYVEIHQRNGKMDLHNKSLEALERILPERFVRVHKSFIVDIQERKRVIVHGGGKYELELNNGLKIPLSRPKYKELTENEGEKDAISN
jgi:two-component system, LytTR family, response regulator LytT